VWLTGAGWPDLVVAAILVWILTRSALRVIGSARRELRAAG
jgi:Co/Zn/Cd efflux system component